MQISGGDKLVAALEKIAKDFGGGSVKVGFLEGATYPDGTNVASVAFFNEYGTTKIPPRPFFRSMIEEKSVEWPDLMARAAKHFDYDGQKVLEAVGQVVAEELQQSIVGWQEPPNAPYTVAQKGFNKPLIHTGHMQNSIDFEVSDGN